MLIVTARIPKRRLRAGGITILCCCLVLVAALVIQLTREAVPTAASHPHLSDEEGRMAYLQQLGWNIQGESMSTQELLIPKQLDESYDSYLTLQQQQGFELEEYCGKHIQRYVYQISNHPSGRTDMQAVLLVWKDALVGGHVQALDGSFVGTLTFPQTSASPSTPPAASAPPSIPPSTAPSIPTTT